MKRLLASVACVTALAVACGGTGRRPAAVVNGARIEQQVVVDELNAIGANRDYLDFIQQRQTVEGSAPGTYDAAFVSQVLLRQIEFALVHQEVRKRNLPVPDECKVAAESDTYTNIGGGNADTGRTLFAKFPKQYQDVLLGWNVDQLVLMASLAGQPCVSDDAAKAYYEAHPDEFERTCFSAMQLATKARADELVAQLEAGADFTALATAESASSPNAAAGGDQGCHSKGELRTDLIEPIFGAAVGDVGAIDDSGAGIVFKITDRKQATLEEARQQASELAAQSAGTAFNEWFKQATTGAKIEIDPRYGSFDAANIAITPPASEPAVATDATNATDASDGPLPTQP